MIRKRSLIRYATAVAAMLAAVMGVTVTGAAPAAAGQSLSTGDLTGAGTGSAEQFGRQLATYWEKVPGGTVQVTEFEAGVELVGTLSGCRFVASAETPYLSGTRIRSRATFSVTGCKSTFVKSHRISEGSLNYNVPVAESVTYWKAPATDAVSHISTPCKRGVWVTELSLNRDSYSYKYVSSAKKRITC